MNEKRSLIVKNWLWVLGLFGFVIVGLHTIGACLYFIFNARKLDAVLAFWWIILGISGVISTIGFCYTLTNPTHCVMATVEQPKNNISKSASRDYKSDGNEAHEINSSRTWVEDGITVCHRCGNGRDRWLPNGMTRPLGYIPCAGCNGTGIRKDGRGLCSWCKGTGIIPCSH